jgi:hypothetical protein
LYNKPAAGCGTSGGISYRNPTLKKFVLPQPKYPKMEIIITEDVTAVT